MNEVIRRLSGEARQALGQLDATLKGGDVEDLTAAKVAVELDKIRTRLAKLSRAAAAARVDGDGKAK